MTPQEEERHIKETIKKLMKEQNITYQELSESLNCSVPTVKRILNQEALSIEKISQICRTLKITFFQLIEASQKHSPIFKTLFTSEQDEFLSFNLESFLILRQLQDGYSVKQVQENLNLSDTIMEKKIHYLHLYNLIVYENGETIPANKFSRPSSEGLVAKGVLNRILNLVPSLIKEELATINNPTSSPNKDILDNWSIYDMKMTPETQNRFLQDLCNVIEKYVKISVLEKETIPLEKLEPQSIIIHLQKESILQRALSEAAPTHNA